MFQLHRLTVLLLSVLLLALFAASCSFPAEPLLQVSPASPTGEKVATAPPSSDAAPQDVSREEIAAQGVEQALKIAPQVADEISRRYWFVLPGTVPWWGSQPVKYAEGDRSRGALRLQFHKQNYQSDRFLGDELALLWQEGAVDGSPDASFEWASRAGVSVGDGYVLLPDACVIDGHECKLYLHRGRPSAGDVVWRIWYDDQADLTYALVIPGQEPEAGLAFEQDFRGRKD